MEILFLLVTHLIAIAIGVVIGVHNANSTKVAPIARDVQSLGRNVVKSVSKAKRK